MRHQATCVKINNRLKSIANEKIILTRNNVNGIYFFDICCSLKEYIYNCFCGAPHITETENMIYCDEMEIFIYDDISEINKTPQEFLNDCGDKIFDGWENRPYIKKNKSDYFNIHQITFNERFIYENLFQKYFDKNIFEKIKKRFDEFIKTYGFEKIRYQHFSFNENFTFVLKYINLLIKKQINNILLNQLINKNLSTSPLKNLSVDALTLILKEAETIK